MIHTRPKLPKVPDCFVCGQQLDVRLTRSKTGKVGVLLVCPNDGRHLRAFVNHKPWVDVFVQRLETLDD